MTVANALQSIQLQWLMLCRTASRWEWWLGALKGRLWMILPACACCTAAGGRTEACMDYLLQALLDRQGLGSTLILCLSWCYALYIAIAYR